ncbi:hypothetical protein DPMN_137017 [Dreissena polymorpha]|uniref:Uncharacterized protein n=1 Tax=Dreissena polymorpha TaxID=45954 RepID=A0A9D4G109_DREPO|nr:hypothetical protein DPMN_137017 [Dreissena polymorpha]
MYEPLESSRLIMVTVITWNTRPKSTINHASALSLVWVQCRRKLLAFPSTARFARRRS